MEEAALTAEERNKKIIGAVIQKADRVCPGALALIGVYGSFLSGDTHPGSDLDLLILINDDRGWQLGATFIQDDIQVGHDLYCTTWDSLRQDAKYEHPHIAKLLDAKIVWCADEKYRTALEDLRRETREKLAAPFSWADDENAEKSLKEAEHCFAQAMIADSLSETRRYAGGVIYFVENAVALLNKAYFRLGVRRRYEELSALKNMPEDLCGLIENVASAETVSALKERLCSLMKETAACFQRARQTVAIQKKPAGAETVGGTYEEMYSNWRNKMILAASTGDRYLAFMSLASLDEMLSGIGGETDIDAYNALSVYDPNDLKKTAEGFDRVLHAYQKEYQKAGLQVKRYPDIDAFLVEYE